MVVGQGEMPSLWQIYGVVLFLGFFEVIATHERLFEQEMMILAGQIKMGAGVLTEIKLRVMPQLRVSYADAMLVSISM